jgi:hypothetical protein
MSTNVNTTTNTIVVQNANQTITVVDNENANIVNVTQPLVNVIEVASPGPQGPVGPIGPQGPSVPFSNIGGDIYTTTSSLQVTGSFIVSGSSTFTNIGPAIFSGSTSLVGATTMSSAVVTGNVTVLGTASINVLQINTTINSTGSNTLGDNANDTQTLYGSVVIPTGSLTVSGSSQITGSLTVSGVTTFAQGSSVNGSGNLSIGAFAIHSAYGYATFSQTTLLLTGATFTSTTGNQIGLSFGGGFAPTSGTATYSAYSILPTINQTGGANGITRGLHINPTLTAATDFRAIESNNGRVVIADTATVTGSNATSLLDLSQTWNTSGAPIGIKLNITDTTSAVLSDLISLQVGGSPRFRVLKSGFFTFNTGGEIAGNLVVGGSTIDTSSQLEVRSTTRGFLIPRMTTTQRDAISTPATGLQIFNSTEGYTEYYDSFWGWMPIANQNEWKRKWGSEYFNDFGVNNAFTGDGVFQTFPVNGGGYNTSANITGTYIGHMGLSTGTNTNGQNAIRTDLNYGRFLQLSHRISLVSRLFIPTLSDVTDRYNVIFGISVGTNSTVNTGCAFIYDEGGVGTGTTASPNWQIITAASSVRTNFVTSVAVAINTWYSFRIESNSTFTEIKYYINDTLVLTETTNIPTNVSSALPIISMTKTAGTNARILAVDYLGYKVKLNSAR